VESLGATRLCCKFWCILVVLVGSRPLHRSLRAQVTNPPIDPLREGLVMSLEMRLGKRGNLLTPGPESYAQVPP
jgi:Glutamate synthase central domain